MPTKMVCFIFLEIFWLIYGTSASEVSEDATDSYSSYVPSYSYVVLPYRVPFYRYLKSKGLGGDTMYTTNWTEFGAGGLSSYEYRYQGIECYLYNEPVTGTKPLYRFFSDYYGNHYYSTNFQYATENLKYEFKDIAAYIFAEPGTGTVPLWQYHKKLQEDNVYTIDFNKYGKGNINVTNQGVVGYVMLDLY